MPRLPSDDVAAQVVGAEAWFADHGLPYFIASVHADVEAALQRRRVVGLVVGAGLAAVALGLLVGLLATDWSVGVLVGLVTLGAVLAGYAWVQLRMQTMAGWALRRSRGSLRLMFPLLTRALPLLLLFITFLFINAEVWQVASDMDRSVLWIAVLLFAEVAVTFLLVRLPEEVRTVEAEVDAERVASCCRDTPVAPSTTRLPPDATPPRLPRLPRANLVVVLLFSQGIQVLLLSISVFLFFLVFGSVAVSDDVMQAWLGPGHPTDLPTLGWLPISNELFQVSVFLAAFSGLYFTVYAVNDAAYREQFFASIARELEQAIGVHVVYETLRRHESESDPQ